LVAPVFVFWPRIARHIAGIIIVLFQCNLILSGNLSFLNWLSIVPALGCFDDGFWRRWIPRNLVDKAAIAEANAVSSTPMIQTSRGVAVVIALLSIQPMLNMLSPGQVMNRSFDPLDLVNTYGAFGSVGRERLNVVFEGTADADSTDNAHWKPYLYKGLPVLLDKRPPQIAPYHLRLDWQMWFAAMGSPDDYPWTLHLEWKLLHNDRGAVGLFAGIPFPDKPPRYIRATLYRYSFATPNDRGRRRWWSREQISNWIPAMDINDPRLIAFLKSYGWLP
jgi:hypothetical protein